MLAVVEQYQHPAVGDEPHESVCGRTSWLIGQPERTSDSKRYEIGMGDRSEVDVPDAVRKLIDDLTGDLYRETRLPGAAVTGQRDETMLCQQLAHLGHLGAAAHKSGELRGQTLRRCCFRYPQRRELVTNVGMAKLGDSLRTRNIAKLVCAEIGEPRALGKLIESQFLGDARQYGLATVGEIAQSRGSID